MPGQRGAAAALLAIAAVLSGCRAGTVPATPPATTGTVPVTSSSPGPGPPKQAGITHPAWAADEYSLPASDRAYGEIAATGAGWVVLVPTWYQPDRRANHLQADADNSVSDAGVVHAVTLAHQQGLKVMLKPHVDLPDDGDRDRLRPTDPDAWFRSYTRFIVHYAELAERSQVDQFCVGTELAGTSGLTDRWRAVIKAVRTEFRGPLVYAANYDEYEQIEFWDDLDFVGVDAYWPLSTRPTTDGNTLRAAWTPIAERLAAFSARWQRPVLFTEAGYASQSGSTVAPYDWTRSRDRSDAEQAAAYQALLDTFWPLPWFAGVHWWMWDDLPGRSHDNQSLDYTPHGKPAEEVLRRFWQP